MPLMSPARTPGASSFRSVLPPSMKSLPSRIRLSGVAPRWWTKGSSAARAFERTISREQGMCLTLPLAVPDETAKNGIRPGQVTLSSSGKCFFQNSSQSWP